MCQSPTCNHDDLNDDLGDIFGGPVSKLDLEAGERLARAQPVRVTHDEKCPSCRGSGRFVSYSGRVVGDCFKCRGKGVLTFRTTVEQREKSRASAAARRDRAAQDTAEQARGWRMANPNEDAWLASASARGFEFAVSLNAALDKYGHLTEKQEAAVRSATAKWIEAAKVRAAAQRQTAAIEISRIAEALATAKQNLIQWPKLRLADFVFSLAPDTGRNAGSIYVKSGETYLGKIADGQFSRSRDCTADLEQAIVAAAADPEAAASAYGLQTGICSCCGRKLTNKDSVGLGIGPICREKWGW